MKCYLVGTPIGNLQDITLRALDTLRSVDVIACEDTRHTLILLQHYEIKKPLISYHQHKELQGAEEIKILLQSGKSVALVTDAGMPAISDPGAILVSELRKAGCEITVIPGATAVTSAVALAGLHGKGFCFIGFLPAKSKEKKELLCNLKDLTTPLVFYSAPHDILKDLKILEAELGDRKVSVIKEITKMFETVYCGNLSDIEIADTRGEFVIVLDTPIVNSDYLGELTIEEHILEYLNKGVSKKDAIKLVAQARNLPKNDVYMVALDL